MHTTLFRSCTSASMWHQLTVVLLKVRKYACHCVTNRFFGPVADIRWILFLDRANDFFHERFFHSRHLTDHAHFLGLCYPHVEVRMGSCAIRNDERTRMSPVDKRSGGDERVLCIREH